MSSDDAMRLGLANRVPAPSYTTDQAIPASRQICRYIFPHRQRCRPDTLCCLPWTTGQTGGAGPLAISARNSSLLAV
jgi:hypothetical protein